MKNPMLDLDAEFPILDRCTFLNHAAVAPLPARTAEAVRRWSEEAQLDVGDAWGRWSADLRRARLSAARLINCEADEICFARNTTHGLLIVAHSLAWRPGDNIITTAGDFPANVYPWRSLAAQGVSVRKVQPRDGRFEVADVERAIDARTRILAVSFVQYHTGFRADLAALGRLCRDRGILFCVDAIQGLGAIPLDVRAVDCDFLSADGHKWLLSPEGLGILYIKKHRLEEMNESMVGWVGRAIPGDYANLDQPPADAAKRFEEGSHAMALTTAMGQSLDLILEVGVDEIWRRIDALTRPLVEGLRDLGLTVASPQGETERSGIVLARGNFDPPDLVRRLGERRIYAAARGDGLRISPHFYNRPRQIDDLLAALRDLLPR